MHPELCIIVLHIWIYIPAILSKSEETKEFCHNERKIINTVIDCDVRHITVTLEGHPNHAEECHWNQRKLMCTGGNYENNRKSLQFSFSFDFTQHAGKQLVIHSRCNNGSHVNKSIIMIPCRSEFTVSVTHNKEHMSLTCQHKFFNLSSEGIHIKRKEKDGFIVTCTWNTGISKTQCQTKEQGHAHKNGIASYKAKYPGEYQCVMGGQIIDIPSKEVPTFRGNTTKEPNSWSNTGNFSGGTSSGCTSLSLSKLVFLISLFITYCTFNVHYFTECGYFLLPI
ncbi:uncharacterized protein LOC134265203 isoform X2 [Saccostrea cucullata]|uniref:uncharacterized protein LOC134265203 isoform X2 n=1 Tax=Saccostrea cuccullata TaxID=36930 RepID=UPI002ECFE141